MPSGWIRWMFEQYGFSFKVVYPPELDAGNLAKKYDVLVFPTGAIPRDDSRSRQFPDPQSIPAEYRDRLADVTVSKTIPQLRRFLNDGGSILTIASSTNLAYHLKLPIVNALIENGKPLPKEKYYMPGSIHQIQIDNSNPLAYGMPEKLDVIFNNNPVFRLQPGSAKKGVRKVAWFDSDKASLRSGWALGNHYHNGGVTVIEAEIGKGKLLIFGPLITFRAQLHDSFKFMFNGIYFGSAKTVKF